VCVCVWGGGGAHAKITIEPNSYQLDWLLHIADDIQKLNHRNWANTFYESLMSATCVCVWCTDAFNCNSCNKLKWAPFEFFASSL